MPQFRKDEFLVPFVQLNTELHENATNNFAQDFLKENFIVFWQIFANLKETDKCWSWSNRRKRAYFRNEKMIKQLENFWYVSKSVNNNWDKPTFVGAAILDLAKNFMFHSRYNIMKRVVD